MPSSWQELQAIKTSILIDFSCRDHGLLSLELEGSELPEIPEVKV